jgi:two-component system sensor histidine kinase HydH
MDFPKSIIIRSGFLLLLGLFSFAILFTTYQNSQSARELADQSLLNTATALSAAARSALTSQNGKDEVEELRNILSDRVVAYALIADSDGVILYHTNERLVGTRVEGMEGKIARIVNGRGRWITLGTGVSAYAFNSLYRFPDGKQKVLRLVLHTHSAERIISRANRQWWVVIAILLLLWTFGLLLDRIFIRQVRLEEEMEREKQLGLIGQMSSVLAHEIRNALGGVKGYVQYLDEKTAPSDQRKGIFALVLQGTDRIESLVGEMLVFSKKEEYRRDIIPLEPLLKEAAFSFAGSWPGKVVWKETAGNVRADGEKLLRALVNVLRNAIEAVEEDSGNIAIEVKRKGRWMFICIEDDGHGLLPEAETKLFTPFFTTKASGTGLGLAIAKKLVEGMGGKITLRNRAEKQGAIVEIQLVSA